MKTLQIVYWTITTLLVADATLYYEFSISLTGYYSDKVLFWTWLVLTVIVVSTEFKKKWARIYSLTLGIIVVLSMLPMMIPFLSIIGFAFANDINSSYELVSPYRIHETSPPGPIIPRIQLMKNLGVLEKVVGDTEFKFQIDSTSYRLYDAKSIEIQSVDKLERIRIRFTFDKGTVTREIGGS
jgi:beta-lactamase regulating signal transducer with metallopeptidase domain